MVHVSIKHKNQVSNKTRKVQIRNQVILQISNKIKAQVSSNTKAQVSEKAISRLLKMTSYKISL